MKAEISLPAVMRDVTIQAVVTGKRRTAFRTWLGCKIFVLAAMVIGCSVDLSVETEQ